MNIISKDDIVNGKTATHNRNTDCIGHQRMYSFRYVISTQNFNAEQNFKES